MIYEWYERKNTANLRKHGLRFEVAVQVFDDPNCWIERSYDESQTGEPRWMAIGAVPAFGMELVVIHVNRTNEWQTQIKEEPEEVIRIISARKASPRESRRYQGL